MNHPGTAVPDIEIDTHIKYRQPSFIVRILRAPAAARLLVLKKGL
jgi:hypothetical protein